MVLQPVSRVHSPLRQLRHAFCDESLCLLIVTDQIRRVAIHAVQTRAKDGSDQRKEQRGWDGKWMRKSQVFDGLEALPERRAMETAMAGISEYISTE